MDDVSWGGRERALEQQSMTTAAAGGTVDRVKDTMAETSAKAEAVVEKGKEMVGKAIGSK